MSTSQKFGDLIEAASLEEDLLDDWQKAKKSSVSLVLQPYQNSMAKAACMGLQLSMSSDNPLRDRHTTFTFTHYVGPIYIVYMYILAKTCLS